MNEVMPNIPIESFKTLDDDLSEVSSSNEIIRQEWSQIDFDFNEPRSYEELKLLDRQNKIPQIEAKKKGVEIRKEIRRQRYNKSMCNFSYGSSGEILYKGNQLCEQTFTWVRDIHQKHLVASPFKISTQDAITYAIFSAATNLEGNETQFKLLKQKFGGEYPNDYGKCFEEFLKLGNINSVGRKYTQNKNPFTSMQSFIQSIGGYRNFRKEFFTHPKEFRDEIVDQVDGFGNKLTSSLGLMLGVHDIMTIDLHVSRQLYSLGNFDVKSEWAFNYLNSKGNKRRANAGGMGRENYLRLEEEAMKTFSTYPELCVNGVVSGSLVTCLLWGSGIRARKLKEIPQFSLFPELESQKKEYMPWLFERGV